MRPESGAPITTVFVRRSADLTWWVLGSVTKNVELSSPTAGQIVSSPVVLTGRALAFEDTVALRIVDDTRTAPLATGFVTGGGDIARPFTGRFPFRAPATTRGAIILTKENARDGQVWSATVIRISFDR